MFLTEFKGYDLTKYNDFLIECSKKDYTGFGTHTHHILPKFMKGTDDKINLIKLSYIDHYYAHLILAECFPENTNYYFGNLVSVNILQRYLDKRPDFKFKHTEESKKLISESNRNRKVSDLVGQRLKEYHQQIKDGHRKNHWVGRKHTEQSKQKIREAQTGVSQSPESIQRGIQTRQNSGKPWFSQESKNLMSLNQPCRVPLFHVESQTEFASKKEAMNHFQLKLWKLNKAIERGEFIIMEKVINDKS